jgi:hypothetical protein
MQDEGMDAGFKPAAGLGIVEHDLCESAALVFGYELVNHVVRI